MTQASVILHSENPLQPLDWERIRNQDSEAAGKRLTSFLSGLDRVEKQVYALRGMAMLLVEERELYRWVVDPEVGDYYVSFDKWLKDTCPESWSYCRQALNTVKELKSLPFEDLLQIKRCNLEQLKKVSSGVRILPDVTNDAKRLSEKEFVSKLNKEYDQHLDVKAPVVMAPGGDVAEFEQAIARAISVEGCETRAQAIRAIAIDYLLGHPEQDEAVES